MKNIKIQLKTGIIVVMAGLYSTGAVAESKTGEATATVIQPLLISNIIDMDFGTVASGSAGGDITMASGGGLSVTSGDADIVGAGGGTPLTFDISGQSGQAYTLTVSNGVLENAAGDQMTVTTSVTAQPALTGGADAVEVTGVLTLGPSQATGAYSTATGGGTSITITANYN